MTGSEVTGLPVSSKKARIRSKNGRRSGSGPMSNSLLKSDEDFCCREMNRIRMWSFASVSGIVFVGLVALTYMVPEAAQATPATGRKPDSSQGTCGEDQWRCDDTCIDLKLRCDRVPDCWDDSDELDCGILEIIETCREDQWPCEDTNCIGLDLRCDGVPDCWDDSDELNCGAREIKETCEEDQWRCDDTCINLDLRCDGVPDCWDDSDELNCGNKPQGGEIKKLPKGGHEPDGGETEKLSKEGHEAEGAETENLSKEGHKPDSGEIEKLSEEGEVEINKTCEEDQWRCDDTCIDLKLRCDGVPDCWDDTDELNCGSIEVKERCEEDQWRCDDTCIDLKLRCDGVPDCWDDSDELGCGEFDEGAREIKETCEEDQWRCDDTCIDLKLRCDGVPDCWDDSDELNCVLPVGTDRDKLELTKAQATTKATTQPKTKVTTQPTPKAPIKPWWTEDRRSSTNDRFRLIGGEPVCPTISKWEKLEWVHNQRGQIVQIYQGSSLEDQQWFFVTACNTYILIEERLCPDCCMGHGFGFRHQPRCIQQVTPMRADVVVENVPVWDNNSNNYNYTTQVQRDYIYVGCGCACHYSLNEIL